MKDGIPPVQDGGARGPDRTPGVTPVPPTVARVPMPGLTGSGDWPEAAAHRQIRRWIVRLLRPGFGSGSGILVGPDLVLTCHHVLADLFCDDPKTVEDVTAAADAVEVTVGLGGRHDAPVFQRRLRLAHDGEGPSTGPAWQVPLGKKACDLDFALLRLNDEIAYDIAGRPMGSALALEQPDWLGLHEIQSPAGLAAGANAAAVTLFMYHYPDPGNGSPHILPMLSTADLPVGWIPEAEELVHRLASEVGSSGAMLFAKVAGGQHPFPIAMHRGRTADQQDKVSLPISAIMHAVEVADKPLFLQLTTTPADLRRRHMLQNMAAPTVKLARNLLDRETQAGDVVAGMAGLGKRIQPVFQSTAEEMTMFQQRLEAFDLPLRTLADRDVRTAMRSWTLAGSGAAPPVTKGVPKWGIEALDGNPWLRDGPARAINAILGRAADARVRGSSILMTAQIAIRNPEDYRALEELLLTLAANKPLSESKGDFLVLLWICDTAIRSEPARQQGRRVVCGLWNSKLMGTMVGMPVELGGVERTGLDPWAGDIDRAFGVKPPEVDFTIKQAWQQLDQTPSTDGRHDFGRVLQALDDRLQDWVYLYFQRREETIRMRR